ncbi:TIGR04086 family membrane protein [Anaerocolumna xylanovorans]|uniref:Putative membrane protein, TIGR04086 family n=1 Tax=Anaerocolumna xylanovorans DSM 12503 TaxID=1121345 RepID=A0A1M7YDI3_9FIRM|nr:TIGR04086 family membrane protein [Anaerocolumna xylanovorans]SHO50663.1 putative membrane protein, TIGR04086 family [Anaerocolumna xylanovorans DSM 12503]
MDKVLHRNSRVTVILKDLLLSYVVTGLMLLLLSFLMLKLDVSNKILSGGIIVTYILSTFLGGFLFGKNAAQKRFLWGLLIGALYFIILFLISTLTGSLMGMEASRVLTVMILCLFGGMLGGMVS